MCVYRPVYTVLTEDDEKCLAVYIADMAEMRSGLTKEDILCLTFRIADKTGRQHPFKDGLAVLKALSLSIQTYSNNSYSTATIIQSGNLC